MRDILFLLFFLKSIWLVAQPKIEFQKVLIDVGEIDEGMSLKVVFEFRNIGNQPLEIKNCYGSGGGQLPILPKNKIYKPGDSGEVEVVYDTKRIGKFYKVAYVVSNSCDTPKTELFIKGVVKELDKIEIYITEIDTSFSNSFLKLHGRIYRYTNDLDSNFIELGYSVLAIDMGTASVYPSVEFKKELPIGKYVLIINDRIIETRYVYKEQENNR